MRITPLLLLLACVHPAPLPVGQPRAPEVQLADTVMVLAGPCGMGDLDIHGIYAGSGVVLDAHHVLTALHVVECPVPESYRVFLPDGSDHPAFLRAEDRDRDQAKLETIEAIGGAAPTLGQAPALGDPVCAATAIPASGVSCSAVVEVHPGWFVSAAEARPGNSGAGVYDSGGALVGVLTQRLKDGQTVTYTLSQRLVAPGMDPGGRNPP